MNRGVTTLLGLCLAFAAAQRWEYHHDGPAQMNDEFFWCCAVEPDGTGYYGGEDRHNAENSNFLVVALSSAGAERWVDNDTTGRVEDICVGEDGLVYAVGSVDSAPTNPRFTVVCYDRWGERRWQYRARAADNLDGRALAVCPRSENGVYVCGWVDFPGHWYQFTVVALDSSGTEVWLDTLGAAGLSPDEARDIVVGPDGNVYACGMLSPDTVYPQGAVVSFTTNGAIRWRAWPEVSPTSICAGSDGNLYVGGSHDSLNRPDLTVVSVAPGGTQRWRYSYDAGGRGSLDMDAVKDITWGDGSIYAGGQACRDDHYIDAFIVSLNPQGGERWLYWFRGPYNSFNWVNELVFTPDGYIHGAGLMCSLLSSVAEWCLTPAGDTVWVFKRDSEGPNAAGAECIASDSVGNVYLGGKRFRGTSDCWAASLSRPQRAVGGSQTDHAYAVAPLADSGFVAVAETRSFGAGGSDGWVLRLDRRGDTLWTRTAGGNGTDVLWDVVVAEDGGFACAGELASKPWLVKYDPAGEQVWCKGYTVPNFGRLQSVHRDPGSGFVLAGSRYNGANYMFGLVIGTDSAGNELWRTEVGTGSNYSYLDDIAVCPGGGWLLTGRWSDTPMGNGELWLVRLDAGGDTLWTRRLGGSGDDWGAAVAPANGGYAIVGTTRSFGPGSYNIWFVRVNESGDTLSTRTWGMEGNASWGRDIVRVPGRGFAVTGCFHNWGDDLLLLEVDFDGNELARQYFGGQSAEQGEGICLGAGGDGCIVGSTLSFGTAGSEDVYVVTTPSGVGISEPHAPVAPPARVGERRTPTIVRGVLDLQSALCNLESGIVLLDASGRKVMTLTPGENDVRHLSPGVYFIRSTSGVERQAASVTRVLLVR
ncbi:hypothetical protein JXB37_05040 [candidate division WOR-3 bacterium]|nr:hypothetical protein [candidate division WOR-3 bacterium]